MIRTLNLNPVEPAQFSARTPKGMDLVMDLLIRDAADQVWNRDLAATLVLEGRTDGQSISYLVPATDAVNGKARVRVPGGDLQDTNGYRMTLVGTVDGVRKIVGVGTLILAGTGIEEVIAADVIDTVDLTLDYDEACELDVAVWHDAAGGSPYDLTDENTTLGATIFDQQGGTAIETFTVAVIDENKVGLSLTVEQVNALPASCWWALVAGTVDGVTTLCQGSVTIVGTITPPLTVETFNFNYLKPATADDPTTGQLVHSNITQGTLKVAKIDSDSVDRTSTLRLIQVGDTITVDVTTWAVQSMAELPAYFAFGVLPVAQAAVTGVTPVTFARPA